MNDYPSKQEYFDAMKGRISKTSIREYSDEFVIQGKFGMVAWVGYWDVWITGVHVGKELTQRKVNSLSRRIKEAAGTVFQELTGEAVGMAPDAEAAYLSAVLLGARKKRRVSDATLANLRKNRAA